MSRINAVELYTENGIELYNVNGVVMTTTESISIKFKKTKSDVNRTLNNFPDIADLTNSPKLLNSETVVNGSIKPIKTTYIDRDIMTLLIMGFTGSKAYKWKKQYIEAFNLMERKLIENKTGVVSIPDFEDPIAAAEAWLITKKSEKAALLELKLKSEENKKQALVLKSKTSKLNILVHNKNTFSFTEIAQSLPVVISGNLLIQILKEAGIIYKQGKGYNLYSKYHGKKLSTTAEYIDEKNKVHFSMKWTGEGKAWIAKNISTALDRCCPQTRAKWQDKANSSTPNIPKPRKKK